MLRTTVSRTSTTASRYQAWLLFAFLCAPFLTSACAGTDPAWVPLSISPAVIQPTNSKLPSSVLLAVSAKQCTDTDSTDLKGADLKIAAPGLSLSGLSAGKCIVTATLNVDPNAPAGNYKVFLVNHGDGKPIGSADFAVMDTTAGPIPPGLAPEVDVMWEILSHKVCNDVFGRRVERNFYCIEVKIGNNSGHPIQLAGIGFSKDPDKLPGNPIIHANTSYASTRAVLLRESTLSGRNQIYHGVEATGLIMAGFIPYFHAANATAHYATAVSIVGGPLLQAINVFRPDRVIGQLNNLDDESFRDNLIVPNNSQVRTMVFIEKRALYEQIAVVTGGQNQSEALTKLMKPSFDRTLSNAQQSDTKFKFGGGGDFSPYIVKQALGKVVVVGDEIEYLQRVQVQGNPATAGASGLTALPSQLDFGNQASGTTSDPQTVTVTNSTSNAMSLTTPAISGTNQDEFKPKDNSCGSSLAAGGKCTITVIFTPNGPDSRAATLTIGIPGGANQTVSLRGVGISAAGQVSVSPSNLTFAAQKIGTTSSAQNVTLTNSSGGSITGVNVAVGGAHATDFPQPAQCVGGTVASGSTCTISVIFKPTVAGARVATLNITYTLGGAQQIAPVNLSGTGQ